MEKEMNLWHWILYGMVLGFIEVLFLVTAQGITDTQNLIWAFVTFFCIGGIYYLAYLIYFNNIKNIGD